MAKNQSSFAPILIALVSAISAIIVGSITFHNSNNNYRRSAPALQEVIEPAAEPCSPPPSSLRRMLECAKMDLKLGRLAFEPKKDMDQGREEKVFVRISPQSKADLSKGFKSGPPTIQAIQVGPTMRASLSYSAEDFTVMQVGDASKIVDVDRPYTDWEWEVTPLAGGNKTLRVVVYADLMLPNGKPEPYEAFVGSALIHVHVRPAYVVGKFLSTYWQWVLGSPILAGAVAWAWIQIQKTKKKRGAGF